MTGAGYIVFYVERGIEPPENELRVISKKFGSNLISIQQGAYAKVLHRHFSPKPNKSTKTRCEVVDCKRVARKTGSYKGSEPIWLCLRHLRDLDPIRRTTPRIGRNERCPCGSGKKYKVCHLKGA